MLHNIWFIFMSVSPACIKQRLPILLGRVLQLYCNVKQDLSLQKWCGFVSFLFLWFWFISNKLLESNFIVWEVGFIHHDRVTSYNLWRHILHIHSKSRLYVIDTDCTFLLFFFQMNTETRKYQSHKGILTHIYSWYRP